MRRSRTGEDASANQSQQMGFDVSDVDSRAEMHPNSVQRI